MVKKAYKLERWLYIMENKKNIEEPKISIKKDMEGNSYLDIQIPEKLEEEIERKVLQISGDLIYPA